MTPCSHVKLLRIGHQSFLLLREFRPRQAFSSRYCSNVWVVEHPLSPYGTRQRFENVRKKGQHGQQQGPHKPVLYFVADVSSTPTSCFRATVGENLPQAPLFVRWRCWGGA